MKIINERVTASQAASESAGPHLTVVPPAQPRQTIERPIEAAAWEAMRFMPRCNSQRVAGGYNVKAFYIALASRCSTLEKTDTGSFRIRLCNLLHGLQCSERKFYKFRRILEDQGRLSIRRTAKSTEVTIIAHRHMAEAPPFQQADSIPGSRIRFHPRVPNQIPPPVAESDSTPGGGVHIQGSVHGVIQGVEREAAPEAAPEAPPPPRGTTTTTPAALSLPSNIECPKCKRSFPANSKAGDVCFDCNATIPEIRRRLDEAGKYKDVSIRSIDEDKKVQEQRIDYKEKCAERERIHDIQRAEYQRREEERRKQQQDPEWQAEQVLKAAEQRRKAQEAHHLRLETLKAKQNERTV